MKKTMERNGTTYTVHTVNGVDTRTGSVWAKQIVHFDPLPNGFNKGLADYVLTQIESNPYLWDQDSWRRLVSLQDIVDVYDDPEAVEQLRQMAAFELDVTAPVCGTAMCFAGWVGEVTGADYLIDASYIQNRGRSQGGGQSESFILVPKDSTYARENAWPISMHVDPDVRAILRGRGFTEETHLLTDVENYALVELGLTDGDHLGLFSGGNDVEDLRSIIGEYARKGPSIP